MYLLDKFEVGDEFLNCRRSHLDRLVVLLLEEGSKIHHHIEWVSMRLWDSRNRVDIVHTYLLQTNRFSLGRFQLGMAGATLFSVHKNAP